MSYAPYRDLFTLLEEREDDDLNRLIWILEMIPGEELIEKLERERMNRRDDHPIRMMWYCTVASALYTRGEINPLIAELKRNESLRWVCHIPCVEKVPNRHVFKRFRRKLAKNVNLLEEMFAGLVEKIMGMVPELGKMVAIDSTGIRTHRRCENEEEDGSYGKKRETRIGEDGMEEEIVQEWFGFKLHTIVDATTEIPLSYRVTKAGCADTTQMVPMMKEMVERHPELEVEAVAADAAYDDSKNHAALWEDEVEAKALRIKCVIPKREEREIKDETLWYDEGSVPLDLKLGREGGLECYARIRKDGESIDEYVPMSPVGFEADRGSIKFRCPAVHCGLECARRDECNAGRGFGRTVRVPCSRDWRRVSPILIGTPKWKRLYKKRTSVERCFGRLKNVLGLGEQAIWAKSLVEVQVHLGMLILVASAYWHLNQGRRSNLNRLSAARLAA